MVLDKNAVTVGPTNPSYSIDYRRTSSVTATEAGYVSVARIDVGACAIAGHVGDKREVREAALFLIFHQSLYGRARRNGDCGQLAQIDSDPAAWIITTRQWSKEAWI